MSHNDYLFSNVGQQFRFLRRFEEMYRNCDDPHGQSKELRRIDYQIVLTVLERAIAARAPGARAQVLDVGCGLGYFTAHVQELFAQAEVSGCDISSTAIAKAKTHAPTLEFFSVDLKERATLPGREYDVLMALHVLCYFTDEEIEGVIGNLHALLRTGGHLLVGHHLPATMSFGRFMKSLDDARALFSRNGFRMRFGLDIDNEFDVTYAGEAVGRNVYFLVEKEPRP